MGMTGMMPLQPAVNTGWGTPQVGSCLFAMYAFPFLSVVLSLVFGCFGSGCSLCAFLTHGIFCVDCVVT